MDTLSISFSLNIFISINLQENIYTHCYSKINRIGTEAYCSYSSSRCNKFVHFMVAFLSLQYKIILRRFVVIKQDLEKRVILHSKFMQMVESN